MNQVAAARATLLSAKIRDVETMMCHNRLSFKLTLRYRMLSSGGVAARNSESGVRCVARRDNGVAVAQTPERRTCAGVNEPQRAR